MPDDTFIETDDFTIIIDKFKVGDNSDNKETTLRVCKWMTKHGQEGIVERQTLLRDTKIKFRSVFSHLEYFLYLM